MSITLAQAREAMKAVVEEQGADFCYVIDSGKPGGSNCYYVPMPPELAASYDDPQKATTGCLIGRILDRLGETRHHDDNPVGGGANPHRVSGLGHLGRVTHLAAVYPDMFADDNVIPYLDLAQTAQDRGYSWGAARDGAERFAVDPTDETLAAITDVFRYIGPTAKESE